LKVSDGTPIGDVMPNVGLHRCLFCATDQAASATVQRDVEIDFGLSFAIIADKVGA
jgi:hypothetical protein